MFQVAICATTATVAADAFYASMITTIVATTTIGAKFKADTERGHKMCTLWCGKWRETSFKNQGAAVAHHNYRVCVIGA